MNLKQKHKLNALLKESLIKFSSILAFFFLSSCFFSKNKESTAALAQNKIAILGDNISTGAGAHKEISFNPKQLLAIISGKKSFKLKETKQNSPSSPLRLWPSSREYNSSFDWLSKNLLHALSMLFFDIEEHSWGYQLAKEIGFDSEDILIAADDNSKINQTSLQAERLLTHLKGNLPSQIFIFFSMNDLCANSKETLTKQEKFQAELEAGLSYLSRNGTPPNGGTKIYVLGFLGLTQIITEPLNIKKEVKAFGELTSCGALRERYFQPSEEEKESLPKESNYILSFIPPNPSSMCPTLQAQTYLATNKFNLFSSWNKENRKKIIEEEVSNITSQVANRVRQFRQATKNAVKESAKHLAKKFPTKDISLFYISTDKFQFEPQYIAGDCFHLSRQGHKKLAEIVKEQL